MTSPSGPLILQSDRTLMLEVAHPEHSECRDFLATFAELVKSTQDRTSLLLRCSECGSIDEIVVLGWFPPPTVEAKP